MNDTFAARCAAAVAATKHRKDCAVAMFTGWRDNIAEDPVPEHRCDCDRDARIGRGMAAACHAYADAFEGPNAATARSRWFASFATRWQSAVADYEGAALAAFAEAAR